MGAACWATASRATSSPMRRHRVSSACRPTIACSTGEPYVLKKNSSTRRPAPCPRLRARWRSCPRPCARRREMHCWGRRPRLARAARPVRRPADQRVPIREHLEAERFGWLAASPRRSPASPCGTAGRRSSRRHLADFRNPRGGGEGAVVFGGIAAEPADIVEGAGFESKKIVALHQFRIFDGIRRSR